MRVKLNVTGIVQGVGFRPFIYRIAVRNGLAGYVRNRGDAGVEVLLEGEAEKIQSFMRDLTEQKPPLAQIETVKTVELSGKKRIPKLHHLQEFPRSRNLRLNHPA